MSPIPVIEAEVDFHVEAAGRPCKTWYTIFGTFPSPTGVRPLVCVHGGPGVPHDCLLSIRNLYTTNNIPVIMYDQLGCGRSTHLPEKKGDHDFWAPELFLLELDNLLAHLGIQNDYDILGQSWGGQLVAEHAVRRPKGLKRLVIANSPASMPSYVDAIQSLLDEMPPDIQATLRKHEADGTLDTVEYQQARMQYFAKHMCRISPPPADLMACFVALQQDPTVNHTMNGPYVFKRIGPRSTWSVIDRINQINVPTLLISGKYDGVPASTMQPFFDRIDKVKWVMFAESSHFPNLEEPEEFLKVLGGFLSLK